MKIRLLLFLAVALMCDVSLYAENAWGNGRGVPHRRSGGCPYSNHRQGQDFQPITYQQS